MSLYGGVTLPGGPDLENIRRLDLQPMPMIMAMQRYGIAIDVPYLQSLSSRLDHEMLDLRKDISSYIPPDALDRFSTAAAEIEEESGSATINANSADQIRVLLFDLLGVGRDKPMKSTATGKLSTGKKQLELCRDDHPVVRKVLDYRERAKLKSTYADSLPKKAKLHPRGPCCPVCELPHVESTRRVHTTFTTTRAETGRLSSKGPNLQNIPIRTELGELIRNAFIASPSRKIVSTDFAQIELRDLAHVANELSMIEVYRRDGDIHLDTAMKSFGITDPTKVDKLRHRLPAKVINFGILYGMASKAVQAQLAVMGLFWDESECQSFIDRWFELRPGARDYLDLQHYRARRYGFVWDVFGRVRRVPEIHSTHSWIREAGLRQAGNMPIQSMSAGQTKLVMGELQAIYEDIYSSGSGPWVWPLLSIHDQVMVECDESVAEDIAIINAQVFSQVMHDTTTGEDYCRVPIGSDSEILDRWKKAA